MATALHAYPTFKVNDDCNIFLERLDNAFYVNKTADTDKVPILLNQIDDVVYKVLHGLCMPDSPTVKSFDVLCTLLRRHYVREVCAWKMRQQFLTARQRSNENVNAWLARLRDMSAKCEFGDEQDLMLCCVFVTGLKWHAASEKIAEINAGAEIEELVTIAQTFEEESAKNRSRGRAKSVEKVLDDEKDGLNWAETVPVSVVCAVCGISGHMGLQCPYKDQISAAQEPLKSGPICFSCGEPDHNFSKCVHKNSYCNYCHEMGHLETVCRHLNQHVQRGGGVHQPVSGVPQPRGKFQQPRGAAHQPEGSAPYQGGGSHQSRRGTTPVVVEDRTRSQSRPNRPKRMCPHCGETDHSFDMCSARLMTCHNCDQVGHLARVCSYEEQEAKPKERRNRKKPEKQQDDLCCIC